jgi:hypothetical protein
MKIEYWEEIRNLADRYGSMSVDGRSMYFFAKEIRDEYAVIWFHENQEIEFRVFYKGGLYHRDRREGPAFERLNSRGESVQKVFYENGKLILSEEEEAMSGIGY